MSTESLTPVMQQALVEFTNVQNSPTAREIKDSNVVAGSLQEIFARAHLPQETDERRGIEELCEALRSKRFVFLYDSKNVRFGHGLWRFLSRPFCKYVDINEIDAYQALIQTIETSSRPKPQEERERRAFTGGEKGIDKRIAELEQLLRTSDAQKDQSDRRVAELGVLFAAKEKESADLKQTVAERTEEIALLKGQLSRAREENAALQAHAREGEQEQVLGLKKELQAKEEALRVSLAETTRLREEIERKIRENEAATEAVKKAQGESKEETQREKELGALIAGLEAKVRQKEQTLQELQQQNQAFLQKIRETEALQQALQQENQRLKTQASRKSERGKTTPAGPETQIAELQAELEEIRRQQSQSKTQVANLEEETARLTANLGAERAKLDKITVERNRLSFAQVESLHQSLKAAFPPSSGWGQWGKKDRFIELKRGESEPAGTESFWVFSEKREDGQVAVFINNGRGEDKWDPLEITLPDLIIRAQAAPGILWYK